MEAYITKLYLFHLIVTAMLFGLIWTIQLVHYPSFRYIAEKDFALFSQFHVQNITYLVGPLMIFEFVFAGLILWGNFGLMSTLNAVSIGLIWLVTFFVSVPCHNILLTKKDNRQIERLIQTNWIRTALWTIRVILAFIIYN